MLFMNVEGYQTLEDRDNPDDIENHGPYKCRNTNAWLGHGYYFWDSNIDWAHEWGRSSYRNKYIICAAGIVIDSNCFDLAGSVAHQMEFLKIIEAFRISGKLGNKKDVFVGQILELMKNNNLLDYRSIRANDDKKTVQIKFTPNNRETTTLLKRTQICLIDKTSLTLHTFKIRYPEKYLNY